MASWQDEIRDRVETTTYKASEFCLMRHDNLNSMLQELRILRAENEALQKELDASCNAEELRQVRAENEALRRDAERYRFIKSVQPTPEGYDAAIDAAMEQTK